VHETEKVGKAKASAGEKIVKDITEAMKEYHKNKGVAAKKNLEFGAKYHQELHWAYDELDRCRWSFQS
jgi:hypothetical protein